MTDNTMRDKIAKHIYAAMQWACSNNNGDFAPPWVEGGNSFAQDEARRQSDAVLAALPVSEWQPIETAPKDGRTILTANKIDVALQYWGQNDDGDMVWCDRVRGFTPTHWMPLPPPPAAFGEGE